LTKFNNTIYYAYKRYFSIEQQKLFWKDAVWVHFLKMNILQVNWSSIIRIKYGCFQETTFIIFHWVN
jgi:hypothetical protein